MPQFKETKVYQLGEAILQAIGKKDFHAFLKDKLPKLIVERNELITRKKKQ